MGPEPSFVRGSWVARLPKGQVSSPRLSHPPPAAKGRFLLEDLPLILHEAPKRSARPGSRQLATVPERGRSMRKWLERAKEFVRREDGPTAVEYAVMLALIIVVCIAAIATLGTNANKVFSNVALNTAAASGS